METNIPRRDCAYTALKVYISILIVPLPIYLCLVTCGLAGRECLLITIKLFLLKNLGIVVVMVVIILIINTHIFFMALSLLLHRALAYTNISANWPFWIWIHFWLYFLVFIHLGCLNLLLYMHPHPMKQSCIFKHLFIVFRNHPSLSFLKFWLTLVKEKLANFLKVPSSCADIWLPQVWALCSGR